MTATSLATFNRRFEPTILLVKMVEHDFTPTSLAYVIDSKTERVEGWLSGKINPTVQSILLLAKVFRCNPSEFTRPIERTPRQMAALHPVAENKARSRYFQKGRG